MRYEYWTSSCWTFAKWRDQFTVIGTHVNLASRLEGRAEKDEIIISPFTMAKVGGKFHVKSITISNDDNRIKSFKGIDKYYKVLDRVSRTNYIRSYF
jgi:class 3 adenylate cyclase